MTGRGRGSANLHLVTLSSGRSTRISLHGRNDTPGSKRRPSQISGADGGGLRYRATGALAAGGRSGPSLHDSSGSGSDGGRLLGRAATGVPAAGGRSGPHFLARGMVVVVLHRWREIRPGGQRKGGRGPSGSFGSEGRDSRFLPITKSRARSVEGTRTQNASG